MKTLICSDIHANLEAFERVLGAAREENIDRIWCLGDIVGYGPDPNACVALVQREVELVVPGNHDWAVLGRLDVNDFNRDARHAVLWTREQLEPVHRDFLAALPLRQQSGRFTLLHGSPVHEIWEYIADARTASRQWDHFDSEICLYGHTHVPALFIYQESNERTIKFNFPREMPFSLPAGRALINPGSVGQPRDGDPRASFAIWDDETDTWTFHRVRYPIELTQRKMLQAGLPTRLVLRLSYGW